MIPPKGSSVKWFQDAQKTLYLQKNGDQSRFTPFIQDKPIESKNDCDQDMLYLRYACRSTVLTRKQPQPAAVFYASSHLAVRGPCL
jgi:hypothetical protein